MTMENADTQRFKDRKEAGNLVAQKLRKYENKPNVKVLGLPRGGIPVAFQIAAAIHAPLDVFIVRKLGVPGQPELAMGAIATGDTTILNDEIIEILGVTEKEIQRIIENEKKIIHQKESMYRDETVPLSVQDEIVILVDDGLATGATMRVAVQALRKKNPQKIVVAVPVAPQAAFDLLAEEADEIFCYVIPHYFYAVGQWYQDFMQTTDDEVRSLLRAAKEKNNTIDNEKAL